MIKPLWMFVSDFSERKDFSFERAKPGTAQYKNSTVPIDIFFQPQV